MLLSSADCACVMEQLSAAMTVSRNMMYFILVAVMMMIMCLGV